MLKTIYITGLISFLLIVSPARASSQDSTLLYRHQLNINTLYIFSSIVDGQPVNLVEFQYKRLHTNYASRISSYLFFEKKLMGITSWINDSTTLNHISGYKYREWGLNTGVEKWYELSSFCRLTYGADLMVGYGKRDLFNEKYKYLVRNNSPDIPDKQYHFQESYYQEIFLAGMMPFIGVEYSLSNRISFIAECQLQIIYRYSRDNFPAYFHNVQPEFSNIDVAFKPVIDRVSIAYYF